LIAASAALVAGLSPLPPLLRQLPRPGIERALFRERGGGRGGRLCPRTGQPLHAVIDLKVEPDDPLAALLGDEGTAALQQLLAKAHAHAMQAQVARRRR